MVHRLLAASLRLTDLPESSKDRDSVRRLSDNLNTRHRNAQMAGRASVELHTLIYFKDRTVLADARITKVILKQPSSYFVFAVGGNSQPTNAEHASIFLLCEQPFESKACLYK